MQRPASLQAAHASASIQPAAGAAGLFALVPASGHSVIFGAVVRCRAMPAFVPIAQGARKIAKALDGRCPTIRVVSHGA